MFICAKCLDGRCDTDHLVSSTGPCEVCHVRTLTWDCVCYKKGNRPYPSTVEEVQQILLDHLSALAKLSNINPKDISIAAQLHCAKEICRKAGISNGAVEDHVLEAKLK